MRLRATLTTLVGVSWLASAAVVPRLNIIYESTCSNTAVHEATSASSETSCSTTAGGNATTATLTTSALPDTVRGQATTSMTGLTPVPKAITVTVTPSDSPSALFTTSVLPVSASLNSSSLVWIASGLASDSSSCTSAASKSAAESTRESSAPRAVTPSLDLDSTVTVTVPKPIHTEATSVLTVTYPDGHGHTATLLVTVRIPEVSLISGTANAPAATPTSTSEDVTVTIYVSPTLPSETHSAWSASSSELTNNTLDSEPTTTVTVHYSPTNQATGPATQPLSLYLPYELTYTLSPGSFLPTPFTGTITITPSSPLPATATASPSEMDSGRPVPLAAVSTAGELDVSSSSATLAATAVTMTYTAFISGSTIVTTVTEYPSLISGTPVVTVLTPSPISNTLGSVPMIPLTITLTSEVSTTSVTPEIATPPAVETGGLDAAPVTVTVTSEPPSPSIVGADPYGSNVDNSPDTTTPLSLATSTVVSSVSIMTITVPKASSEDSTSSMQTTWDLSAAITVTESARESRATPSSPVPIANTPSGTPTASVILVTYTVPGLSGAGPSSYIVTYTVQPSETTSSLHESVPVTSSSNPETSPTPDISSAKSSSITSPAGTEPTVTITYTVGSSVSSSSTPDSSPTEISSTEPIFSTPQASGYGAATSSKSTSVVVVTVTQRPATSSKVTSSSLLPVTPSSGSEGATTGSNAELPTDSGQYQYHTTSAVLPTSASDQFTVVPTTDLTLPISTTIAVSTIMVTLTQTVPLGTGSSSDSVPPSSAISPTHGTHNTTAASSQSSSEVTLWPAPTSSVSAVDPIFTSRPSSTTELNPPRPSTTCDSSSHLRPTTSPATLHTSTNGPIGLSTCTKTLQSASVSVTTTATPLFSITTLKPSLTTSASGAVGQSSFCNGSFSGTSIISTISISLVTESGITLGLASPPQTEFHHHAHAVTDNSISTLINTLGGYGLSEPDSGYGNPSSGYGVPAQTTSSSSSQSTSGFSTPLPYGVTSIPDGETYGFTRTTSSAPTMTEPGTVVSTTTVPVPVATYTSPVRNSTSTGILSSTGPVTTTHLFSSTATNFPSYSFTSPSPTPANFTTSATPEPPVSVTYTFPSTLTSARVTSTVSTTASVISSTAVDATSLTAFPSVSSSVVSSNATRTASTAFTSTANTTAITSIPIIGTSVGAGINTTTPLFPTASFPSTTVSATNPFLGTTLLSSVGTTATIIPSVPPFPNITTPARTSGASPTTLKNTVSAPTSFANTMTGVVPSGNLSTSISVTGVYNYTTTAFHSNITMVATPTQSAPFQNQTAPVPRPSLNNTASVFTRSLMSTLTSRILTSSTAHATLMSTPTISAVSKLIPRSLDLPIACGMGGDRGAFVLEFDDIPRSVVKHDAGLGSSDAQQVPSPYHRFLISNGFRVTVPQTSKYEPSSGHQLLQHDSYSAAQIGFSQLRSDACFRFDFHGMRLGCSSVDDPCVFQLIGLQWNGVEDVIQGHAVFTIPTCSDSFGCTLSHRVLDPSAGPSFTNLTAINITLAAPRDTPTWWMDDVQIAWTDNDCVTAACRARVPNTVVMPHSRGSFAETASRFLRWAVRG